jgi:RNA polymerase sigma-70 factor (ECF subfamily)
MHRDIAFGLAVRLTADRDLAEEVLLEAFTAAWTGLPGFREDSGFRTWVCGIIANRARDALRRRGRRRARSRVLTEESASGGGRRADAVRHAEDRIDLERAIATLPPGAREALLLRHVYGFSCAEAAEVLGVSVGTVKSQTSRACALLRDKLSHD